jgi:phosphoribosylamine-glycine ligase
MSVRNASQKQVDNIARKVGFPLIVKPAGLASSLLISMCYDKKELRTTLQQTFKKIDRIYKEVEGRGRPEVLVEEYMEGEVYSIDAYVQDANTVQFTPMVHSRNGKTAGFDDFFEYIQSTPTLLNKDTEREAHTVARKAINALGLTYSSAHIELMLTEKGWKIIEMGPRIGGWRPHMYKLSYGFSHSINDLINRIPQKPVIKTRVLQHTAVMQFYPKKEGILKSIKGERKLKQLASFVKIKYNIKRGERSRHAKNGSKPVFNITLSHPSKSSLQADIRRVEKMVEIITE